MTKRLERSLPGSMKQYAGAFVQQSIVEPSIAGGTGANFGTPAAAPHFNPHPLNTQGFQAQNHFQQPGSTNGVQPAAIGGTPPVQPASNPYPTSPVTPSAPAPAAAPLAPTPQAPPAPAPPTEPVQPVEPDDFIMHPATDEVSNKHALPSLPGLSGANSLLKRAIFGAVGLVALLIILSIVKGLFSGTSNLTYFVSVAQDQQEIIHLTNTQGNTTLQQNLTSASQNFAATANASLTSSQADILTYLANNKYKKASKQLGLKVSSQLDTQLTNAVANGTYDSTFQQILKAQLTTYLTDLNTAYQKTPGKKGRTLLNNDYIQGKLLISQLSAGS
jgi:hypothetical protein